MAWVIDRINGSHDRKTFDCGHHSLNDFIRRWARDRDRMGAGATYVAVAPGAGRVLGFHTIATGTVTFTQIPKDLPKSFPTHPIPTVHIGRLAVDAAEHRKGLGKMLTIHSLKLAASTAQSIGVYAVDVFAVDDAAKGFYEHLGFISMRDTPRHLFMEIDLVRQVAADAGWVDEQPH